MVDEWEQDRDLLRRHTKYRMFTSDQQYALLNMCPCEFRKEFIQYLDFKRFPTDIARGNIS